MKQAIITLLLCTTLLPLAAQRRNFWSGEQEVIVVGIDKNAKPDRKEVLRHFRETHVTGFQQSHIPNFIITTPNNRFMLGLGGYVNFRTAYDMGGAVQNLDFVTYDIPVPFSKLTQQKLTMSSSTSRLFFKAIANTERLGRIVTYIETDFRGTPTGNLRLRLAYISVGGWLFGQNVTTFCDLNASPTTIDFQGPNAYNLNFNTMLRYSHTFGENWSVAAAFEMPQLSATFEAHSPLQVVAQRCPDLPAYVQYAWKSTGGTSHLRATGVVRSLVCYDNETNKSVYKAAWGAQLSGSIWIAPRLRSFFNGVYGRGITPYIQDLTSRGYDLVPVPDNIAKMQTLPMWGWFAALQYNVTSNAFVSGGYSHVKIDSRNDYHPSTMYDYAEYIFGNVFCNITPSCRVAVEYLFGRRKDYSGERGNANRVQAMIQYNF